MNKYRKKPVVVEAYQTDKEMNIETLEGTMRASAGDYIITGINGEQYPCKPDIFEKTYEKINTQQNALNFGQAIEVLKKGGAVTRRGWNGKEMFLFLVAVNEFTSNNSGKELPILFAKDDIICMKTAQNTIAVGWVASQADMLGEDWVEVKLCLKSTMVKQGGKENGYDGDHA